MSQLRITHLAALFTGDGFAVKQGRFPQAADCGFRKGPLDLVIDLASGRLVSISPSQGQHSHVAGEQQFDGRGLVATPAFVDSHTHALFSGTRAREYFMRWAGQSYRDISDQGGGIHNTFGALKSASDETLLTELHTRLLQMRAAGTLTVEIKTGYGETPEGELRMLRLIKRARLESQCPVRIRSTFLPLHALPRGCNEEAYVSSMIELLPIVAKENLADHVDAFPEEGFFSLEQSLRFAREALKFGLRSKVHADELSSMSCVESFVPLEALSADHLQKISSQGIESLVASNTVATFLPSTSFFLDLEYAPARRVLDAGARVALASDFNPGTAPEGGLQLTALLAASRMKLSAPEIFAGLTYNAAAALGLETQCGVLRDGQLADILLWDLLGSEQSNTHGSDLLSEIFVESKRPVFSFLGGAQSAPRSA
jgi:imidazolonepropionase